jgi:hypothetical protein
MPHAQGGRGETLPLKSRLTCLGMIKKALTMSTTASSARMRVIRRDQNPDGKYDMRRRRRIAVSGSPRVDSSTPSSPLLNTSIAVLAVLELVWSEEGKRKESQYDRNTQNTKITLL